MPFPVIPATFPQLERPRGDMKSRACYPVWEWEIMESTHYFAADWMGGVLCDQGKNGKTEVLLDYKIGFSYRRMMERLGIDIQDISPPLLRQITHNCIMCRTWRACQQWFDESGRLCSHEDGSGSEGYGAFCPNAVFFDCQLQRCGSVAKKAAA